MTKRTLMDHIIIDWFSQLPSETPEFGLLPKRESRREQKSSNPNEGHTPQTPLVKRPKGPDFAG
jgi:hypothetical protein